MLRSLPQEWLDAKRAELLTGRFGTVDEIAPTVGLWPPTQGRFTPARPSIYPEATCSSDMTSRVRPTRISSAAGPADCRGGTLTAQPQRSASPYSAVRLPPKYGALWVDSRRPDNSMSRGASERRFGTQHTPADASLAERAANDEDSPSSRERITVAGS